MLLHDSELAQENVNTEYSYLLARFYLRSGNYARAFELLRRVKRGSLLDASDYYQKYYHAGAHLYLSQAHALTGNMDSCDYYYDLALNEYLTFDSSQYYNARYYNGGIYAIVGDYKRAQKALSFLEGEEMTPHQYKLLGRVYEGPGDYAKSARYFSLALSKSDSLNLAIQEGMRSTLELKSRNDLKTQEEMARKKKNSPISKPHQSEDKNKSSLLLL
ncbi:MAG: tetratricopeptide repeat protein [Crocinitomicaceae bacterium]